MAQNHEELIEKQLKSLPDIDANMNINVHFVHSHLDNWIFFKNKQLHYSKKSC